MRKVVFALVLIIWPSMAVSALRPSDFAYGIPLTLKTNGAVYRITIPLEVYENLAMDDLRDIRIFNASEKAVPYILRRPQSDTHISEQTTPLPIFPLYNKENSTVGDGLSVHIEKSKDGTLVNIGSDDAVIHKERKLTGYLIDTSNHEASTHALEFIWPVDAEDFTADVFLEYSNDLTLWKPLVFRSTLVQMRFGGQAVIRKRMELPDRALPIGLVQAGKAGGAAEFGSFSDKEKTGLKLNAQYLRLTCLSGDEMVELEQILAVERTGESRRKTIWTRIESLPKASSSGKNKALVYEYDSSARLPADRIRIIFTEKNTLVNAGIFSRPDPDSAWRLRQSGILCNLDFGQSTLIQDTMSTKLTFDRYWRLEIAGSESAASAKNPLVELGWSPHELLFIAQGDGPFMMAYGSAILEEDELEDNPSGLISKIIRGNESALVSEAILSPSVVLGGRDLLVPGPPPLPWRDWILWCILVFGVGVIAKMALNLSRGMNKKEH